MGLFDKLLHAGEGRKVKVLESVVPEVGAYEPEMERRTDAELRALSDELRAGVDRVGDQATERELASARSTISCPRRSRWSARPPGAPSASVTSTSS